MTIKSYHNLSGYTGIFEDNGSFGILYIQDPQGKTIRDGWVYNRVEASPAEVEIGENTFRVPDQYVTETLVDALPEEELELSWEDEGETLYLLWKGQKAAGISFLTGRGTSIWFSQICPWGLPMSYDQDF